MRKSVQIQLIVQKEFPSLSVSNKAFERLDTFLDMLSQWNKKINLTGVKDKHSMIVKHILDAMIMFRLDPDILSLFLSATKIMDMGSGAGIPGIILSIIHPELPIDSVDKVGKKIAFQEHVKRRLDLSNLTPIHSRLDGLELSPLHAGIYEFIISRAFDQIKGILNHSNPFLIKKGYIILWKGENWRNELDKLSDFQNEIYKIIQIVPYKFEFENHGGTLLVIQKQV